jgi:hypothetical protein
MKSNDVLKIIHLSAPKSDAEPYVDVDQFPEKRAKLVALSYEEARAMAMVDCRLPFKLKRTDRVLLDRAELLTTIRVGNNLLSCQGEIFEQCRNNRCRWHDMWIKVPIFALVPCAPSHAGTLWKEYSQDVELCFGLCRSCETIIAVNQCT